MIGGFAVNYYKVTRQTLDIDFLTTADGFRMILPLLEKSGYKEDLRHEIFVRLKSSDMPIMDLDFMFVDDETMDRILKNGNEINIAGEKFIVPSLNNLIALKLHSIKYNPKNRMLTDLPDIINLIKINNVNFKKDSFKELCMKYGNEQIYKNIINALK